MRNPSQVQEAIALHIQAIINLIGAGGEANNLDLVNTPKRVAVMFTEDLFSGYRSSEEDLAKSMHTTDIDQPYGMVVETNIPFTTVCAHHLMPFQGTAAIGYQPKSKLLGLSKLPRILYHYAARLQIQERLTHQVASFILEHAEALAVFVHLSQ
jgi:GTP cyclohydrolase I